MTQAVGKYDAILIVSPENNPEALSKLQAQFNELVTQQGGRVLESSSLGKRRLSYSLGKLREGNFLQVRLELPPEQVAPLKKALRLVRAIARCMIVRGQDHLEKPLQTQTTVK